MEKGKHMYWICEINKRHKAAMVMLSLKPALKWTQINDTSWKIESQQRSDFTPFSRICSTVSVNLSAQLAMHASICTQPQAWMQRFHATVCRHIHLVHMQSSTKQGNPEPTATSGRIGDDKDYYLTRIFQSQNCRKSRGPSHTKEEVTKKMDKL